MTTLKCQTCELEITTSTDECEPNQPWICGACYIITGCLDCGSQECINFECNNDPPGLCEPEACWSPCVVCGVNEVNAGDGYDTCRYCVPK